jgi:hypothetical protein
VQAAVCSRRCPPPNDHFGFFSAADLWCSDLASAVCGIKGIILDTKAPPAARMGAATAILDRGYGKPGQTIALTSIFAAFDLTRLSDAELEQLDALRRSLPDL